jgi:hypothetical protein
MGTYCAMHNGTDEKIFKEAIRFPNPQRNSDWQEDAGYRRCRSRLWNTLIVGVETPRRGHL